MSRPALSASRAADFKQCPPLYRFRAIDRLPEAPSAAQLRGSVVHGALERLLLRFERTLTAIWRAIRTSGATGDFRPSPSRLCNWCANRALCPAFGRSPPPYPGWPADSAA